MLSLDALFMLSLLVLVGIYGIYWSEARRIRERARQPQVRAEESD